MISHVLFTQSICQPRSLLFSKIYFAIDFVSAQFCQSFAHKVEEKNGRQLTLSVGCCRYMKGGEAMCRVASNCLRPDGKFWCAADKWDPLARIKARWMKVLIRGRVRLLHDFCSCQNRLLEKSCVTRRSSFFAKIQL